jgi:hypothetical protein
MSNDWYCLDCEEQIDPSEIESHESADHTVKGQVEPDRLLSQNPRDNSGIEGAEQTDTTEQATEHNE